MKSNKIHIDKGDFLTFEEYALALIRGEDMMHCKKNSSGYWSQDSELQEDETFKSIYEFYRGNNFISLETYQEAKKLQESPWRINAIQVDEYLLYVVLLNKSTGVEELIELDTTKVLAILKLDKEGKLK